MKLLISFLLITIIFSSCSDSPVSPVSDASNKSSKSNVIKTNEFLSNPDVVLKPGNIAEIKISDLRKLNSGKENVILKIKYSIDENQEYEVIKNYLIQQEISIIKFYLTKMKFIHLRLI